MSKYASTSVTVSWKPVNSGEGKKIVMEDQPTGGVGSLAFVRHYPPNSDQLKGIPGSVRKLKGVHSETFTEIVQFNNSTSAGASHPITNVIEANIHYVEGGYSDGSDDSDEDSVVADGYSIRFDREKGIYVSGSPVYASILVTYRSTYAVLEYRPLVKQHETVYGQIFSRIGTTVATHPIKPPGGGSSPQETVIYEVVSTYLVGENSQGVDGSWERPVGWPDNLSWGLNGALAPDKDDAVEVKRIHEQGVLSANESVIYRKPQNQPRLNPFFGHDSYHPQYKLEKRNVSQQFKESANSLRWEGIYDSLRESYPGIEIS